MALQLFSRNAAAKKKKQKTLAPGNEQKPYLPGESLQLDSDPLNQCLQLERFGYLLANREQWKDHPDIESACQTAREQIDEMFAIVPEGFVSLPQTVQDDPGCEEITVETASFLLGRYTITNEQYQKFVDAGGYEALDLWPKEIWPHLIDFKDQTEAPGPRYWQKSRHCEPLSDHPVVGVCYYEAAAFARWAGFRLPTEEEWQMAASWRIRSVANVLRRYPWGDALDTQRCNIWASGMGHTVSCSEYSDGAAPNHVLQLIGNVWEWTSGDFNVTDSQSNPVVGDMRMSSIRGGAFDTYFPLQATSIFRTGLASLARTHNTGFRCAMDISPEDSEE